MISFSAEWILSSGLSVLEYDGISFPSGLSLLTLIRKISLVEYTENKFY